MTNTQNAMWKCPCNRHWSKCGLHYKKCIEQRNRIKLFGRGILGCEPIKNNNQQNTENSENTTCRTRTTDGYQTIGGTGDTSRTRTTGGENPSGTGDTSRTRTTGGENPSGTGDSRTCTKRGASSTAGTGDNKRVKPSFFHATLLRWKLKRKASFLVDDYVDGKPTKLGPILANRFHFN